MSGDVSDSAGSTDSVGIAGSGPEDLGSRPSDDVLLYAEKVHVERHASQGGPDAAMGASRMLCDMAGGDASARVVAAELGSQPTPAMASFRPGGPLEQGLLSMSLDLPVESQSLFSNLQQCLLLRDKYIDASLQGDQYDNPKNWDAEYCVESVSYTHLRAHET